MKAMKPPHGLIDDAVSKFNISFEQAEDLLCIERPGVAA